MDRRELTKSQLDDAQDAGDAGDTLPARLWRVGQLDVAGRAGDDERGRVGRRRRAEGVVCFRGGDVDVAERVEGRHGSLWWWWWVVVVVVVWG